MTTIVCAGALLWLQLANHSLSVPVIVFVQTATNPILIVGEFLDIASKILNKLLPGLPEAS